MCCAIAHRYLIKGSLAVVMLEWVGQAVGPLVSSAGVSGVAALLLRVPSHAAGQVARAARDIAAPRPGQRGRAGISVHPASVPEYHTTKE